MQKTLYVFRPLEQKYKAKVQKKNAIPNDIQ